MKTYDRILFVCLCGSLLAATSSQAKPKGEYHQIKVHAEPMDTVGDVDGTYPAPRKALQDTVWIADWSFDTGSPCDDTGWSHLDYHQGWGPWGFISLKPEPPDSLKDSWYRITNTWSGVGAITGNALVIGYELPEGYCCELDQGYQNDWYFGLQFTYTGSATISFDYLLDTEECCDYLQVETDSACASWDRVDRDADIFSEAWQFRTWETQIGGFVENGVVTGLALTDYGPGTHCVYLSFFADTNTSPCDGIQSTTLGVGAVIDNVTIVDASGTRTEDFEGAPPILTNLVEREPFGDWARVYQHITDNDICSENTTCAWLWSDHITPTLFNDPSMSFGPDGYVVRNWLDNMIVSPWVSLSTTPTATGTVMNRRQFGGNDFAKSLIAGNWAIQGKYTRNGQICLGEWGNAYSWSTQDFFFWASIRSNLTPRFDPTAEAIRIRFRTADWQWIAGAGPPSPFIPGPGPYRDRIRIGRQVLSGPVISEGIDSRGQAQDCFPTVINPDITPAGAPKWMPSTNRFGTCAFSFGSELGINARSPNLITGDSITIEVRGVRVGGEVIAEVGFAGAIVGGPHAGKAPPPYVVGSNGFFLVDADSVINNLGEIVADNYFVSLDDTYFRGGDALHYFWFATDNGGAYGSDPAGLSAPPASVAEAQSLTAGLLEVSYLPTINWDPAYIARIQGDAHGDLEPTEQELANSSQAHCILYYNQIVNRRLSGDVNRTSFMYTLDRLGYKGHYDVYDVQGYGNTNNQLASRASIQQAQGYNLIIQDSGNQNPGVILTDGLDIEFEKIDQAGWYSSWLAQASLSEAQFATLWIVGSNVLQEKSGKVGPAGTLLNTNMGVILQTTDQALSVNPDVAGVASFVFDTGTGSAGVNFAGDVFTLNGGCPVIRDYDGAATSAGTAVATHRYRSPTTSQLGDAALVMNRNNAMAYNTILQTHPWFDIRDDAGAPSSPSPEVALLNKVLSAVLPVSCLQGENPTGTGEDDVVDVPQQTALHQNVPNPFNPMTAIQFDLAQSGRVALRVYDVAGRLVRTLLDEERLAGRNQRVTWNGLDDQNRRVSSGVYFYRLEAEGVSLTRKMVVMK